MSSPHKKTGDKNAIVEDSNTLQEGNDDTTSSITEIYEEARKLEEAKNLLVNASDADVSSLSSSDSIQTVTNTDIHGQSGTGTKLQKSPRQDFKRMVFDSENKEATLADESSDEKESKRIAKKEKKSPRKTKCCAKEETDRATCSCNCKSCQDTKHGSKRTRLDTEEQMDSEHSSCGSEMKSNEDCSKFPGITGESTKKKSSLKRSPEKIKKTRLGSSDIAADLIEDAIDHTDDSVFTNVVSSEYITGAASNAVTNTGVVTDIIEDAVDHTDKPVFSNVGLSDLVAVSNTVQDTGNDETENHPRETGSVLGSSTNLADEVAFNREEAIPYPCESNFTSEDQDRLVQEQCVAPKLDFHEAQASNRFRQVSETKETTTYRKKSTSLPDLSCINADPIEERSISDRIPEICKQTDLSFSQLIPAESTSIPDRTPEICSLPNVDNGKTESSESNQSDEKMEFSSGSTIPGGLSAATDIEKMDCNSDTYSGFESFKLGSDSNTTMEFKSESPISHDKMEIDSISLKSNVTEGMDYSSGGSTSNIVNESISVQESLIISVQRNETFNVHRNESTSIQRMENITFHRSESMNVQRNESNSVPQNVPISDQVNEPIGIQETDSIVRENIPISVQEKTIAIVRENEPALVQENPPAMIQENQPAMEENEPAMVQENEPAMVQENEPAGKEVADELITPTCASVGNLLDSTVAQENVPLDSQENVTMGVSENILSNILGNVPLNIQENESVNVSKNKDSTNRMFDSVPDVIGDFVTRLMHEAATRASVGHTTIDSDSNSSELKSINEANTDPNTGMERQFTIPRTEASDTEEYVYDQNQASATSTCPSKNRDPVGDQTSKRQGKSSLKRRKSAGDKKEESAKVPKITDVRNNPESLPDLPETDSDELKDSDDDDKKGSHKKFKK